MYTDYESSKNQINTFVVALDQNGNRLIENGQNSNVYSATTANGEPVTSVSVYLVDYLDYFGGGGPITDASAAGELTLKEILEQNAKVKATVHFDFWAGMQR